MKEQLNGEHIFMYTLITSVITYFTFIIIANIFYKNKLFQIITSIINGEGHKNVTKVVLS